MIIGFEIGYLLTGPGTESGRNGVVIKDGSKNVEIRNGTIKSFYGCGAYGSDLIGIGFIALRVRDTDYSGLWLSGADHLITDWSVQKVLGAFGIAAYEGRSIIRD